MDESTVRSLLSGVQFSDPRMYSLLDYLIADVYRLDNQLNPPSSRIRTIIGSLGSSSDVTGFSADVFPDNLRLRWTSVSTGIDSYELRYHAGTSIDWDSGDIILRTSTLSADINPLTIPLTTGNHTFLIKAVRSGIFSGTAAHLTLNVPAIDPPVITSSVIGNFVLLRWTVPISLWRLDYYNIYKNGVIVGKMDGTFEAVFETTGGVFDYSVEAIDIVGNSSGQSSVLSVQVGNPNDFTFFDVIVSDFDGIKVNCIKEIDKLLALVDDSELWSDYLANGYSTINAEIAAGYTYWAEPTPLTGSYQEVFDFGVVVSNVVVTMDWNITTIIGTISLLTSTIEYSDDGITWSSPVIGTSIFAASLQFVRFTFNFSSSDDKALALYSNLRCLLAVHRETDGGSGDAFAADVAGTEFFLNKDFLEVESITVTPNSTTPAFTVWDDTNLPVSFKVFVFDETGARIDRNINWVARGII